MPGYGFLAKTDLDFRHIADDLKVLRLEGVPYTAEMIENAAKDVATQATTDAVDGADLVKRYPKAQIRDFDGNATAVTEADALIAYLQMMGTQVDFNLYDDKANIR
jgi:cytochrome c oxidase cbb3-type subunit 2